MARKARETKTGTPQVFFIGAAGNVAAGKYNDGSEQMRPILAARIEKAMEQAALQIDYLNKALESVGFKKKSVKTVI